MPFAVGTEVLMTSVEPLALTMTATVPAVLEVVGIVTLVVPVLPVLIVIEPSGLDVIVMLEPSGCGMVSLLLSVLVLVLPPVLVLGRLGVVGVLG